jgi:hypothetical protein
MADWELRLAVAKHHHETSLCVINQEEAQKSKFKVQFLPNMYHFFSILVKQFKKLLVDICVFLCVCERERERETEWAYDHEEFAHTIMEAIRSMLYFQSCY